MSVKINVPLATVYKIKDFYVVARIENDDLCVRIFHQKIANYIEKRQKVDAEILQAIKAKGVKLPYLEGLVNDCINPQNEKTQEPVTFASQHVPISPSTQMTFADSHAGGVTFASQHAPLYPPGMAEPTSKK